MINILRISPCDGGDGIKVTVDSDGVKNTYTVSAEFYLEKRIEKGDMSEDILYDIVEEDKLYAARRAAVRILAAGQCSAHKLYEKLRKRGFPHECAKNATDVVAAAVYIDEDWQIENYLKTLVEKKYFGRRKVLPTHLAKGYRGERISAILDEKYTDSDFKKFRAEFLVKTFGKTVPETAKEAAEMKKALYKQGY